MILTVSFMTSAKWIYDSFTDWADNPMITSLDSIDSPLYDIQFPTITVCHEQEYQMDNWAIPEMVLNFLDFEKCQYDQCSRVFDTKNISLALIDHVANIIEGITSKHDIKLNYSPIVTEQLKKLEAAINANLTNYSRLREILAKNIGATLLADFLRDSNLTNIGNVACQNCTEISKGLHKFLLIAEAMFRVKIKDGFGTFLRTMSPLLGLTFDSESMAIGKNRNEELCNKMTRFEQRFHEMMAKISEGFGLRNVSVYDLPNFYKILPSQFENPELRRTYPMYTICNRSLAENKFMPSCPQYWKKFFENGIDNPYESRKGEYCGGKVPEITGNNLTAIMEVMKFAYHLASNEDYMHLFGLLKELKLPYDMIGNVSEILDVDSKVKKFSDRFARYYTSIENENSNFEPVLSDKGLCYAWNHNNMFNVYQDFGYLEAFGKAFHQGRKSKNIKTASLKTITLIFDKHENYLPDRIKAEKTFLLGINSANDFFDMTSNPTLIQRGYKTRITVKPLSVVSDSNTESLSVADRKCRFENELPENMTFFKTYSLSSCMFDCMLKYSASQCKCIPWDLPRTNNDMLFPICDSAGNFCFHSKMKDHTFMGSSCYCLPSCNSIKFSYTEKPITTNLKKRCFPSSPGYIATSRKFDYTWPNIAKLQHYYASGSYNSSSTNWNEVFSNKPPTEELCQNLYESDIAVVEIQIEGQSYVKMRQSLRVTFTDKLGTIGGTLGICTGFSVLALVEALYWTCIVVRQLFGSNNANDDIIQVRSKDIDNNYSY